MASARRLATCGLLATVAWLPGLPLLGQASSIATAYLGVNVVDVDQGTVAEGLTLIVADGLIQAIQDAAEPVPAEARVVAMVGYYVVPGLIDAHVHFLDSAGARNALLSGVTTARSMGSDRFFDVDLREQAEMNPGIYPEVLAAGYHIRRRVPQSLVALHPELADLPSDSVPSEEGLRRLARVQLAYGIDVLKTGGDYRLAPAAEPGIWRRRWQRFLRWLGLARDPAGQPLSKFGSGPEYQPMFSQSDFAALVAEARAAGVGVAVHAHSDASARSAARAGVVSIEHGTYLTDSTLAIMADRGVYLVPSLSRTEWREHAYLERVRAVVREAQVRGVPLAAGTDARYTEGAPPLPGELQAMERAGVPRSAALKAGTVAAARLLGIDDRTGRLEPGYEADFLVLSANPLEDLTALDRPLLIVSDGVVVVDRR